MKRTILLPVVVLKSKNCYSAFSPKVDGCIASDASIEKVLRRLSIALASHLKVQSKKTKGIPELGMPRVFSKMVKEFGPKAIYTVIEVKLKF